MEIIVAGQGQPDINAIASDSVAASADPVVAHGQAGERRAESASLTEGSMSEQSAAKASPMALMQSWLGIIVLVGTILATNGIGYLSLRAELSEFRKSVDRRFELVDARFERVDARFERVDARFDRVDARFDRIDERLDELEARLEKIERENIRRDARIETLGNMLILIHGNGVVTVDDLKEVWLRVDL